MSESGDGGDTASRHGIVDCFDNYALSWKNHSSVVFVNEKAECVRHPKQIPWNNFRNFSRDQLICLAAGLYGLNFTEKVMPIINALKKPLPFIWICFNSERDYPGTTKHPYPHKMSGGDPKDNGKWRMFDYADPLLPHHILHLYNCAAIKPPKHIEILGKALLFLSCVFNSKKLDNEQNQLQCMVKTAGEFWIELYMKFNPNWQAQTEYYWNNQRNCPEFYNLIINKLPPDMVGNPADEKN